MLCYCGALRAARPSTADEHRRPTASELNAAAAAVEEGLVHHRSGRLADAEAVYNRVLAANPEHPGALHLLGLIAHATAANLIE
ncbi:MAG: tetratricopeptide repeat protein [Proteobacteria bacterium]|nr:tetratricopeptide repeat protein [Pseudomonadota bacterium]